MTREGVQTLDSHGHSTSRDPRDLWHLARHLLKLGAVGEIAIVGRAVLRGERLIRV
jgi:hypothetical protein